MRTANLVAEIEARDCRRILEQAVARLPAMDRRVVRMRLGLYGHFFTLKEVGWLFGVSSTRVQQIEARSLRQLRRTACATGIADYRIQGGLAA